MYCCCLMRPRCSRCSRLTVPSLLAAQNESVVEHLMDTNVDAELEPFDDVDSLPVERYRSLFVGCSFCSDS
jgi:hypothetical protein